MGEFFSSGFNLRFFLLISTISEGMAQQVALDKVIFDHKNCSWFLSSKRELFTSHPEEIENDDDDDLDVKLIGTVLSTGVIRERPADSHLLLNVQLSGSGAKRVVIALAPGLLVRSAPKGERYFMGKKALETLMEIEAADELRGEKVVMNLCFP